MRKHGGKHRLAVVLLLLLLLLGKANATFTLVGSIVDRIFEILCSVPIINLLCNECKPDNPCQNGGKCSDRINDFVCDCATGYDGDTCELCANGFERNEVDECVDINECTLLEPCAGNGFCTNEAGTYTCACFPGWIGKDCDEDVDECETVEDLCGIHGVSCDGLDPPGSFTCECEEGWQGDRCEEDIDECAEDSPCGNRGNCTNTEGNFTCTCDEGWEGTLCETPLPFFPNCDVDVFVIGMGWAGSGAAYEFQRYNDYVEPDGEIPLSRPISFKGADKAPFIGGRADAARVISGGRNNPIHGIMRDLFQKMNPNQANYLLWHNVDWEDYTAYHANGTEIDSAYASNIVDTFSDILDCVYENVEDEDNGWAPDDTVKDVLIDCGWTTDPDVGTLENAVQSWDTALELLFDNEKTSALNFPLYTYQDWRFVDTFVAAEGGPDEPSNGAVIADRMVRTYVDDFNSTIMLETDITGIDYTVGSECVVIDYVKDGVNESLTAGKAIFSGSAGVMNKYGDNEYNTSSWFDPVVPSDYMTALRKIFFLEYDDGTYRESMSNYKELIVQLAEDDPADPDTEFLFFETLAGKRGHCHIWQDLDIGQAFKFFDGSKTFLCELSPSVVNEDDLSADIGNTEDYEYSDAELEDLINATLGQVLNLTSCERWMGPLQLTPPTTVDQENKACLYQMFNGIDPPFGYWGGGWASLMAADWTFEDDVALVREPIERDGVPVIFVAGEHLCPRHGGYMDGAYWSGIDTAHAVLGSLLTEDDYDSWDEDSTATECEL